MLAFCNHFHEEVWVAYMFYSPGTCGGEGNFQTIGWYAMAPGQCVTVYANSLGDVHNANWYYYAESASGTVWNGPVQVYVTNTPFNHCFGVGTSQSRIVGYRLLNVGSNSSFTLTLTP